MSIQFNEKGHATTAGTVRVFYYDAKSKEYCGWSDEFIPVGVSLPGNSTLVETGEPVAGQVWIFDGGQWLESEDHRGETVYSIADRSAVRVNYLGALKEGFTAAPPATEYDAWNGHEWETNTIEQKAAAVEDAERNRQGLINTAMQSVDVIQLKLRAGRQLTDAEQNKLDAVLNYIDELTSLNIDSAPDIDWPTIQAVEM